jgi:mono/diheme cytochrome c family protein
MSRLPLLVAAAFLTGVLALSFGRTSSAHGSHAGVIRGAVLYQRLCGSCHGREGHGDGPRAAEGLARPADLTQLGERLGGFDRDRVAALIDGDRRAEAHGTAEQPAWGEAGGLRTPAPDGGPSLHMKDLLDYLEHSQGPG